MAEGASGLPGAGPHRSHATRIGANVSSPPFAQALRQGLIEGRQHVERRHPMEIGGLPPGVFDRHQVHAEPDRHVRYLVRYLALQFALHKQAG